MAGCGTPEPWAKRLGEVVSKIRTRHKLSRPELARQMYDCLPPGLPANSPLRKSCSDKQLQAIEEGTKVKITRDLLELLCQGLRCTEAERIEIFLAADRNVFADSNGNVSDTDEALLEIALSMRDHPVIREQLMTMIADKQAPRMSKSDRNKIIKTMLLSLSDFTLEPTSIEAIAADKKR